ncbi:MAG: beta-N-acetylhexosaminidase [Verrucomicrobiae bacterium]|nr:beta-N-acetylhexosaminidase [Verrucomicrobiae bacterium]
MKPDLVSVPHELRAGLAQLERDGSLAGLSQQGIRELAFLPGALEGEIEVRRPARGRATIHYDRPCRALRGLGSLASGVVPRGGRYRERSPFATLGVMLDCSRNAVMTVEHLKRWMSQLALLGFNAFMLYTEDTYELPGEPYFGACRGRYTATELREVDAHARSLGIELIGCIQTLGHLERVLRWSAYRGIRDAGPVLLVDHEPTYALIEKMVAQVARCLGSRRINLGLDEAHMLGRGRSLDRHGYRRPFDLFQRHLRRVVSICRRHGLAPMMCSDMYFRMGSATGDYYDERCRIPADVRKRIPRDVQLVYWDYYKNRASDYRRWIRRHRALGSEPVVLSGVWTWGGALWYDRVTTEANTAPCVAACRQEGIKEMFFSLWGDDGAFCEYGSALAGLAFVAEKAHVPWSGRAPRLARRFKGLCGADYIRVLSAARLNAPVNPSLALWDDPLYGIYWNDARLRSPGIWSRALRHYRRLLGELAPVARVMEPVDFAHAACVLRCLCAKVRARQALEKAWARRDLPALARVRPLIRRTIVAVDGVLASFRRQWLFRNKPQGLETLQFRLAGLKQRYVELGERIEALVRGEANRFPELEERPNAPLPEPLLWWSEVVSNAHSVGSVPNLTI